MSKDKDKARKNKRFDQGTRRPTHAHPKMQVVDGTPNLCDKEGCGARATGSGALCDRHDLAIRAVVSHYLQPSIAADAWQELLSNASAQGYKVDWHELAEVRDVTTPDGWCCAICGGTMHHGFQTEAFGEELVSTVSWVHECDEEAAQHWMAAQAHKFLGTDPSRVLIVGDDNG